MAEELETIGQHVLTWEEVRFALTFYDRSSFCSGYGTAKKIGNRHYFECSAKSGEGAHELHQHAGRAALEKRRKSRREPTHCVRPCIIV